MRGTSLALRRSLRTRVTAASFTAAAALAGVVCLLLPHGYRVQEEDRLRAEAAAVADALALRLSTGEDGAPSLPPDAELSAWAVAHRSLDRISLFDAEGAEIGHWPEGAPAWNGVPLPDGHAGSPPFLTVTRTIRALDAGEGPAAVGSRVAVRMSTAPLLADVNEVRWLFGAILLLMAGVFVVLTRYFTQSILAPLEEISRAAQSLADGEPMVQWPETGDREIDELGEVISRLGESRRNSRVMEVPHEMMKRLRAPTAASGGPKAEEDAAAGAASRNEAKGVTP